MCVSWLDVGNASLSVSFLLVLRFGSLTMVPEMCVRVATSAAAVGAGDNRWVSAVQVALLNEEINSHLGPSVLIEGVGHGKVVDFCSFFVFWLFSLSLFLPLFSLLSRAVLFSFFRLCLQ